MTNQDSSSITPQPRPSGRRRGAIGLAGGLLAGTTAGLVFGVAGLTNAASSDVSPPSAAVGQQVGEGEAPLAGESIDVAVPAMGERVRESLQVLVDDGTITAEQADAVTSRLAENRPDRGERGNRGDRGELGERGGRDGQPGMFGRGVGSEALTDLLGLDAAELRQQVRDGATLAEIAEAQGIEVQAVIDELVSEVDERLTSAVEDGRVEQSNADQQLAEAEARITDMATNGRD